MNHLIYYRSLFKGVHKLILEKRGDKRGKERENRKVSDEVHDLSRRHGRDEVRDIPVLPLILIRYQEYEKVRTLSCPNFQFGAPSYPTQNSHHKY